MVRWVDGGTDGLGQKRPGKLHFPANFNGEIFTEVTFFLHKGPFINDVITGGGGGGRGGGGEGGVSQKITND